MKKDIVTFNMARNSKFDDIGKMVKVAVTWYCFIQCGVYFIILH